MMKIGFDFGSKNISAVLIENNKILKSFYKTHNGDVSGTFSKIVDSVLKEYKKADIESFGICGSVELSNLKIIDSILAEVEAIKFLKIDAENILSVGCETFSLVILDKNYNYIEHSTNPLCASGTGSFIDQQAERIGFTTEKLADVSYNFKGNTPSIATRCAVFAKSDIIHSQAEGYSKEAIAAGLCEGMARSILSNLLKGREIKGNVLFIGGVAENKKIVSEVSKILQKEVKTINEGTFFNAIGAALLGREKGLDVEKILSGMKKNREKRKSLEMKLTNYPDFSKDKFYVEENIEITEYENLNKNEYSIYIGIDIGSTSTKSIVIDREGKILLGCYTKTAGVPVVAVQKIFSRIKNIFKNKKLDILGVGTTGSGRKLVKEIINADLEVNEITAHAKGATFIDPEVDTIIEIGGQDSKFTLLDKGNVTNASMNYVCAAGTGSFIEEQAKRLGITLDEISGLAIGQSAPYTSDRCTVYMERDLNIFLSEGWSKEQIIASVLFSVRDNYLSKVVGRTPLGNKIFFQGATARNKALVAVFENEVAKPVMVSKYCHLTGALGVAVLLKEKNVTKSVFSGMDFNFTTSNEICELCINKCSLSIFEVGDRKTAWGLKCGRDYEDKKVKVKNKISSVETKFTEIFKNGNTEKPNGLKVGIPLALYLAEYYPLFENFLQKIGFEVIIEKGNSSKIKEGSRLINSDFCAPMILTHGIVASLKAKNVDYIFLPALINEQSILDNFETEEKFMDKNRDGYFCYYSEYAPTIVDNLTGLHLGEKLISPKIKFNNRDKKLTAVDVAEHFTNILKTPKEKIAELFIESLNDFENKKKNWKNEGQKTVSQKGKPKIMLLGRPYSVFDQTLNLGIPLKLEEMGFDLIYQSMISYNGNNSGYSKRFLDKMHWFYGQEIIIAAEMTAKSDDIYPVFLTCFRCSPDSYLITYVKEIMAQYGKPYLIIQLDEHTSDVGYLTRIEAGLETFLNDFKNHKQKLSPASKTFKNDKITKNDTVLVPYLSPIISVLQKASFEAYGYKTIILPLEQKTINTGYKYASGGECMPNVAITGSIIETIIREKLKPENVILYMPMVCMACNFSQYSILIEIACEKAGFGKIKIANPNTMKQLEELPKELNVNLLEINILGSLLYKLYFRFNPYEKNQGETKAALDKSLNLIKTFLKDKKPLMEAAREIRKIFEAIPLREIERKPRIGVLGDLYAKYNSILNQDIYDLIEELDGEIVIPSFTETVAHFLDADVLENGLDVKFKRGLTIFERRYERVFEGLLNDSFEPPMEECNALMKEYGINHYIAGETSMNIGRMLYYIKNKTVDAVVHLNPLFCCPGVVSASIFRKIQKDFNIPIIDLFYDGNNKPNKLIIPQLYYLSKK
jgi:predicted CoA-substrate-specific enzyme activase